jgi:gamma-glutamylcyclotransferase (GGCT)/AIG2-like uncharacterized protein YtfP
VGARFSPWLVKRENEGFQVSGQVFVVDSEAMEAMDRLERITKQDGYRKVRITVINDETKKSLSAYAYLKSAEQLKVAEIRLGPLRSYEHMHANLYQPRSDQK